MQEVIVDIVFFSLLVIMFGAAFRERPDHRLRCWLAGWLCVLAHFFTALFNPPNIFWLSVRDCASMDLLALAGIFFIVSTMILTEGRRAGLRLGTVLAITTLACISLAIMAPQSVWPLCFLVLARQGFAVSLATRPRPNRRAIGFIVLSACLITGGWMFYGVIHTRPEIVICALLAELFFVSAIDFWNNGWQRSTALKITVVGLVTWAAVLPVSLLLHRLWPQLVIDPDLLHAPKMCAGVGMIIMVLEEDVRAARTLTEEYRLLFESNPHPLWIFETETLHFLNVNQAALDKHGYTREEFLAMTLPDILDPSMVPQVLRETASPEPKPNRASRHICKDGTILPMDITAYSIEFQGKQCRFVLALDVTEREKLQDELVHQAQHDFLTGLPNRMLFQELLTEAVRQSVKAEEMLAVLCLDLIRLKNINDTYGIGIGDECIQRIAGILGHSARAMDIVARTGGGEFAIVLAGIKSAVKAEQVANDLRVIFSQPLLIEGYKIQLSFSMGLAVCPDDGKDAIALWRRAESAQRQSRAAGGGETVWFSSELNRAAEEQIELEAYMRLQLERGGFHLAYQPLYAFDGTIHGLEALLRLDHPKYGAVSPARFIPIAEETGLIVPLGQWVIEEVCRQLQVWKDRGIRLVPVAGNGSGLQLMHVEFVDRVMDSLLRYAIEPRLIHLEVTESVAMRNQAEASDRMVAFTARGIAFSIDDFGTGHSSLYRLHQLPISVLKIDRSFIDQLCLQNGTYSIVQAVISMAHALGLRVVAEGVETESQLACLHMLQCDLLQGFLLSRPVSPEHIPPLLASTHPAFSHIGVSDCGGMFVPPDKPVQKELAAPEPR